MATTVYLIGSLRNPAVPAVARVLRGDGHDVYDEWFAAGPRADDTWRAYEKSRGHSAVEAYHSWHAQAVFNADKRHLDRCDVGVLLMPAGKSGHLELGYMAGQGKRTYVLLTKDPDRYDVMYRFTNGVFLDLKALRKELAT